MNSSTNVIRNPHGVFTVEYSPDNKRVQLTAELSKKPDDQKVAYIAAAPVEFRTSVAGSGLPYTSKEQAFHNTPNMGMAQMMSKKLFRVLLDMPGSY